MTGRSSRSLPGAEGTLKVAEPKPSKLELFNAALAGANNGPSIEAITEKKKKAKEEAEAKAAAERLQKKLLLRLLQQGPRSPLRLLRSPQSNLAALLRN